MLSVYAVSLQALSIKRHTAVVWLVQVLCGLVLLSFCLGGVVCLGRARVCWEPLIVARSGMVVVARAWNVMFDVPVMRIVSVWGVFWLLGLGL